MCCYCLQLCEAFLKFSKFPVGNRILIYQSWLYQSYFEPIIKFVWLLSFFLYICRWGPMALVNLHMRINGLVARALCVMCCIWIFIQRIIVLFCGLVTWIWLWTTYILDWVWCVVCTRVFNNLLIIIIIIINV